MRPGAIFSVIVSSACLVGCAVSEEAKASTAILNVDCNYLSQDLQLSLLVLLEKLQGRSLVFGEIVENTEGSRSFDYLDFSADNIVIMSQLSLLTSSEDFYLEIPNGCDARAVRAGNGPNLTKLDLCYHGTSHYLLRLSGYHADVFEHVGRELFEHSSYKGNDEARGYPEGYQDEVIDKINTALEAAFNERGNAYKVTLHEVTLSPESQIFGSVFFERKLVLDRETIVSRLRFVDHLTGAKLSEVMNVFDRRSGDPICSKELASGFSESEANNFIINRLPLITDWENWFER